MDTHSQAVKVYPDYICVIARAKCSAAAAVMRLKLLVGKTIAARNFVNKLHKKPLIVRVKTSLYWFL